MKKQVFSFKDGNQKMRNLLGGKGANLCEMLNLGLPVPLGFIVTSEACNFYYENNLEFPKILQKEIFDELANLEKKTAKRFCSGHQPLLLSVRSGARVSMPGMMDTILNLGLNDQAVLEIASDEKLAWFAHDSYRRFIGMYANVVKGMSNDYFDLELTNYKDEHKIKKDQDLSVADLKKIIAIYKKNYKKIANEDFPQDPFFQLTEAVKAIFRSWSNERAKTYRNMHNIPDDWGTAVIIQEMVYGNNGENSGSGVAFSRNPATGEDEFFGEFLINAQGEDVVAGIRTPMAINELKKIMPDVFIQLYSYIKKLERHYRDMQDIEFTIENGKLYMLQTRAGKRTMQAAIKIVIDLVNDSLLSKEDAISRLDVNQFHHLLHPVFDIDELKKAKQITKGLATSPGAATGKVYFQASDVITAKKRNEKTILVRLETSPEDIEGMANADGILTVNGGMTSHAAVVARGMGICCVSGCSDVEIVNNTMKVDDITIKEGEYISIDGTTGKVYLGQVKTKEASFSENLMKILSWANQHQNIKVMANADTEQDAVKALDFFAKGIGLCRTEHMFFKEDRILQVQKMILATDDLKRNEAIKALEKFQESDFYNILQKMNGLPVTIRYLDPPLHEFMPKDVEQIKCLAKELDVSVAEVEKNIDYLSEVNPMMGHRGCRLAVTYPELIKMQTRAVVNAILRLKEECDPQVELMIPLISDEKELKHLVSIIKEEIADKVICKIGTMIEVPRAALIADKLAPLVDFFSFGTNDLTQMTYGFSRDDASKFLDKYYQEGLFSFDPFVVLDKNGVGKLIKEAVCNGRKANKNLKIGICGEHGANYESIKFFFEEKLDYISCSPYRIPTAILASAQLTIRKKEIDVETIIVRND